MIDYDKARLDIDGKFRWRMLTEECAGYTFIPNQPQFDLIQNVGQCIEKNRRVFLMTSANGTGKSTAWVNILANIWWPGLNIYNFVKDANTEQTWPGFFSGGIYDQWPLGWPKMCWMIGHQKNMEGLSRKIEQWFPPEGDFYDAKQAGYEYNSKFDQITNDGRKGFELRCLTVDMDWKAFESDDVGIIIFDEPPKFWQYQAAVFRLRMGGIIIIAATGVADSGWFVDIIDQAGEQNSIKYYQSVHVDENSIDRGGLWDLGLYGVQTKGVLGRTEIDLMKDECKRNSPDLYPARIEGKVIALSGLVIKNYDREVHFVKPTEWPFHRNWYWYRMIVDDHGRRPPFIIWVRYDRWGNRRVIREWPSINDSDYRSQMYHDIQDRHPMTVGKVCDRVIEIEEELEIPLKRIERIMDPKWAQQPNNKTGLTMIQEWIVESTDAYKRTNRYPSYTSFSFVRNIVDDIEARHNAIRRLLEPTTDGNVMLTIDPDCRNVDFALRRYKWKDEKPDFKEIHGLDDKLEKKHKDPIDVLGYDATFPFTWREPDGYHPDTGIKDDYIPLERLRERRAAKNGRKPRGVA